MADWSLSVLSRQLSRVAWPAAALAALLLFNAIATPGFYDVTLGEGGLRGVPVDIASRSAMLVLLALGMTLVIATGGVDLSVGAVMAIAAAVGAVLVREHEVAGWLALLAGLGLGLAAGAVNGSLVAFAGVRPIVATLVLMVAGRGLAQLMTGGQVVAFDDALLVALDSGRVLGVPMPVVIASAAFAVVGLLCRATALGLFIEAIGDSERAATLAGVPVGAIKAGVYIVLGVLAALAGLLAASDIRAADANNLGLYLELDAILAVVLGGTPLAGGRFSLLGSVLGALFIQALTTTLYLHDVAPAATLVVKALAVVAVCLLLSPRLRAMGPRVRRASS